MTINRKIYIVPCVLLTTMACAFVQNMLFPPSPTLEVQTQSTSSATPVSPISTENAAPTMTLEPVEHPEPIVCTDDDCLNACLDRLETVLETRPFAPIGNSIYEEQGANFDLVIYKVNGDEIADPTILYVPDEYRKYQEDTASHFRIWEFYVAIIPPELRKPVKEFVIFTDGPYGDAGAWVRPSSANPNDWQVGFDLLDSDYPLFVADALVHETAHLLTLNTSQLPEDKEHYYFYDGRENEVFGCSQYAVDGKCSLPDSYINLFYQKFWKDIYQEWWELDQKAQDTNTFEEYENMMEPFYLDHQELFLDSYAATNVEEDMAESFSHFVLNPRSSGQSVADQKSAFYYDFPELVEYRQQIIEGLCSYVK